MYRYPVYQPFLKGNEKKYVNECLDTTWISSKGKFVKLFEEEFAKFIGVAHATSVSNGTVALHLALETLGIGRGDEVIVPAFTYIASVNAIAYTDAKPVFIDSLASTWQMDPAEIVKKITPQTKAVLVVHLYGHPCEMDAIQEICKQHKLLLIEDCAEAFGSKYKDKFCGTFGDIATFSFFGNKTITTGEGGMVVTNNELFFQKAAYLKNQGVSNTKEYWHDAIGYNYRMTNVTAAIGLAQVEQASAIIEKKRQIANWYDTFLAQAPIEKHKEQKDVFHSYWMYTILVDKQIRDALRAYLRQKEIETRPTFYPAHVMPMYKNGDSFPVAEDLAMRGINLPSYPDLSKEDVAFISKQIVDFYNEKR